MQWMIWSLSPKVSIELILQKYLNQTKQHQASTYIHIQKYIFLPPITMAHNFTNSYSPYDWHRIISNNLLILLLIEIHSFAHWNVFQSKPLAAGNMWPEV